MSGERIYLDYNASAPLLPAARRAMLDAIEAANPSSVHAEGRAARRIVDEARRSVAALVGAAPADVIFTSGASEGAAMLLSPRWRMGRAPLAIARAYICASDHPCVLDGGSFAADAKVVLPVDRTGTLEMPALEAALQRHDVAVDGPPLVLIHAANNETGVVQPMRPIADMVHRAGGVVAFDTAQAAGRISIDLAETGADFLILSSHKIGGPKGVGAVIAAGGALFPQALVAGGGQERGLRAGTENVAGIAGFGASAGAALDMLKATDGLATLRRRVETAILETANDAVIHGAEAPVRLPNTVFFSIPGMKAETAQIAFDLAGVAISAGSACSSGKVGPSHVLRAMSAREDTALRVSLGVATTEAQIDRFAEVLASIVARSRPSRRVA